MCGRGGTVPIPLCSTGQRSSFKEHVSIVLIFTVRASDLQEFRRRNRATIAVALFIVQ